MAFDTLKQCVTGEPVLAHPNPHKQFNLEIDASGFMVGAVLLQKGDGKSHPIMFYLATLNEAEQNYNIYNLELVTIMKML
jgi:hypothetical protein